MHNRMQHYIIAAPSSIPTTLTLLFLHVGGAGRVSIFSCILILILVTASEEIANDCTKVLQLGAKFIQLPSSVLKYLCPQLQQKYQNIKLSVSSFPVTSLLGK